MNYVVIINGTYGVGKTSVAKLIAKECNNNFVMMDPDEYYNQLIEQGQLLKIGWPMQSSKGYLREFRHKIEDTLKENNVVIPITITTEICKCEMYDYLNSVTDIVQIVLFADDEIVINRIDNDKERSKEFAKENMAANKLFLEKNFPGAIWLDTSSKSAEELADIVISLLS